jgi:hypothetical protein
MKLPLLIVLGVGVSTLSASAQQLVPLNTENTGENSSGGAVTAGASDPNYTYAAFYNVDSAHVSSPSDGTPGTAAIVTIPGDNPSPPWPYATGSTSPEAQWVAPNANQNGVGNSPGVYVYQLTFNSSSAQTVAVSGQISADNYYEIAYNTSTTVVGSTIEVAAPGSGAATVGSAVGTGNTYGFDPASVAGSSIASENSALSSFNFNLNVASGSTTLDFLVLNEDPNSNGGANQTGLLVTNFQVVATPEPSTWAILILGLGLVAFARYRTQRVKVATATAA